MMSGGAHARTGMPHARHPAAPNVRRPCHPAADRCMHRMGVLALGIQPRPTRAAHVIRLPPAHAPVAYPDWGSLTEPRLVTGADGGGTTGPMSPSGASSRSTITGA